MAHVRKAWLICDVCEKQIEIDPTIDDPFRSTIMMRGKNYENWGRVQDTQVLCPECFAVYKEEKEKSDEHLQKLAGLKTINVKI